MKRSALSFLSTALLLTLSCSSPKNRNVEGCENFKKGKFTFHPKGVPEGFYFTIQRTDSTQTESDNKSGHSSKYSIRWSGKCDYELLLLETNYPFTDSQLIVSKTIPVKTTILSSTGDYYVFRTTSDDAAFVLVDTMWVEK